MIPPSFIQDLLARTDIVEVVGRYVTLKKAGINFKGLCPFHGEKSPSFIVSPSRQTYHCFGCGVHGNAVGFLMENAGLGFVEAVKDLAQIQGMPVPDDDSKPEDREKAKAQKEKQTSLTDVMAKATQHWRQQLKSTPRAVDYLKARGLTGEIAARFGMGYAPDNWRGLASVYPKYDDPLLVEAGLVITSDDGEPRADGEAKRYDRFRDRIMFPIRNPQGEVIGFGGRVLDKGEPKYLNSPETPVFIKGRELYGLYEGRSALRTKGYALVTEGYMDVVALAQWGFGNAVATLGTACSAEHVQKLFRFTEQVVFSFDGDGAGRRAAGRALEAALPFASDTRRISFLFLPAEHDPDSYIRAFGPEAFEACVQQAVPLSRQLLEHAKGDCDLNTAEGRARLQAQALPLIGQLPEGALRGQIADELAAMARTAPEEIRRRLAAQAEPKQTPKRGHQEHRDGDQSPPWDNSYTGEPADEHSYQSYGDDGAPQPRRQGGGKRGDWKKPWDGNSRWQRKGSPVVDRRPLPQAAGRLDRIVWLMIARSDFWEQVPASAHDLLCEQPAVYGHFFRWLDRLVHDQGAMSAQELIDRMRHATLGDDDNPDHSDSAEPDPGFSALAQRITNFHDVLTGQESLEELLGQIKHLQLQSMQDELELLTQSGELSDSAEARKIELIRQSLTLKLEISRMRPTSAS
ncbi:DNA primase [Aquabacterium sp. CECT 9606]|uniref:DNA primase n=1 Tax=Aquabacterium sp. CECT 9606 TaxID=2845822 RepID=UPI001E367BD6|nr:DNA primase [Aquabacterium sp. CECT 9606]CAH0352422.1 DNA primase [Aquabacterium sp. CECT 9606]